MKKTLSQPNPTVDHKCSLILRLWRVENSVETDWRASVEIPLAGKRIGFSNLEQLFSFLVEFTENGCALGSVSETEKEIKCEFGRNDE